MDRQIAVKASRGLSCCIAAFGWAAALWNGGAAAQEAGKATGEPITIGVIEDRSGPSSFYSQESVKAFKLYVDAINNGTLLFDEGVVGRSPGILGRPIRAIYQDDQANPNLTPVKARQLLSSGAQLLFFLSGSGATMQGRVVCVEQKVACLAPTNISTAIVKPPNNEYIFELLPTSDLTAGVEAKVLRSLGYHRMAIISDQTATSKLVGDNYRKIFATAGLELLADESVPPGARDVTAELLRIKSTNPDFLFELMQDAPTTALMYQTFQKLTMTMPRWSTNTMTASPAIWKLGGKSLDGILFFDNIVLSNPHTQQVERLYRGKYGADAPFNFLHAVLWDGLMIAKKAIEAVGSTEGTALKNAIENIQDFSSAYGRDGYTLSFAPDRHNGASAKGMLIVEFRSEGSPVEWKGQQPE